MNSEIKIPKCLGIPVQFVPGMAVISDSSGVWPWKRINVGATFFTLTPRQQGAVLLHEAGHCKLFHTEKLIWHALLRPRLLWAILAACHAGAKRFASETAEALVWFQAEIERRAPGIAEFRQAQERQADYFAAQCGYGPELAQVLTASVGTAGPFHPDPIERAMALTGREI